MSAIDIIRTADAAYMFTDGAAYRGDGTLGAIGQKVYPVAHLKAAFSCRGPSLFMPLVANHVGGVFSSFDDMVAGLSEAVRVAVALYEPLFAACETGPAWELFVAGWSDARQRPESYVMTNAEGRHGLAAWTLTELGPVAMAPWDDDLRQRLEAMPPDDDPMRAGLAIMEAQRHVRGDHGNGGEAVHGVGGLCQVTVVTRDAIQTAILRRWPDRVGEKIEPERMAEAA